MPTPPGGPIRGPEFFRSPQAYPQDPAILSVDPGGGYTASGVSVTITGNNFKNNSDGSAPSVLFGTTPGTSVIVVSTTSITVIAPAASAAGIVNISVTIDGHVATLFDGFLYFQTTLQEIVPTYGTFGGGTQIEIRGYNIDTAGTYQVRFGSTLGTNVVLIDAEHVVVTTPAHAVGFVDVVLETSPGGVVVATLTRGFQFTQLTRVQSIRRSPGIVIQQGLNNRPNTCNFSVDGASNKPVAGEQINIIDTADGNRLLFAGNVQKVDQEYEGLINQYVWRVTAIDFTALLNRRRPVGTYYDVSASEIVKDLVSKFSTGFSVNFVQTNLAKVSMAFDGSRDFSTCLSDIATAIGGGHWKTDYTPDVHFFHVKPPDVKPLSPIKPGPGSALVAAEGAAMPNTQSFTAGYYYFRTTFLYSNGTESSLGPGSVIVAFDGLHQMDLSSIPIGANPGGGITCTGRRIYFVRGIGQLQRGWKIADNVTAAITVFPGVTSTATVINESNLRVTITLPPPSPPPPAPRASTTASNPNAEPIGEAPLVTNGGAARAGYEFSNGVYFFHLAPVYANGTEGEIGPASNSIVLTDTQSPVFLHLPRYAPINGVNPIGYKVYVTRDLLESAKSHPGYVGGSGYGPVGSVGVWYPHWPSTLGILPYTNSTAGTVTAPSVQTPATVIQTPQIDFGQKPRLNTKSSTEFTWPNNDGPYLEDTDPPETITDASVLLLRDPQIVSSEDVSQLRNRVIVHGAATSVTVDAQTGDTEIEVADVSIFNETGGTVLVGRYVLNYFAPSSFERGEGSLFLETALPGFVLSGESVCLYLVGEDIESQNARGRVELDVNGQTTDGIHEYVVSDNSLTDPQQLYTRLYAELEVFSRPIVTVRYATRDPKTKTGQTVNFNLTNPPLKGAFLIQDVTIDQIGEDAELSVLHPRYTATATSSRFELEDLLLQLVKAASNTQSPSSSGPSSRGVIDTAITGGPNGSFNGLPTITNGSSGGSRGEGHIAHGQASAGGLSAGITPSIANMSAFSDAGGYWARASSAVATTQQEVRSGTIVNPQVSFAQATFVVRTGPDKSSFRIWIGAFTTTASGIDTDTLGVGVQACGWRLSSAVPDAMFQPFMKDNGTGVIRLSSGNRSSNNWYPNTVYTFQLLFCPAITFGIAGGPGVAFFTNGEYVAFLEWGVSDVLTLALAVEAIPQTNSSRIFDHRSTSFEVPYSFHPSLDVTNPNFGQAGTLTGIH